MPMQVAVVMEPEALSPTESHTRSDVAAHDRAALGAALTDVGLDAVSVSPGAYDDGPLPDEFAAVVVAHPAVEMATVERLTAWIDDAATRVPVHNPPAVVSWNLHRCCLFDLAAAGIPLVPTQSLAHGVPFAFQRAALRRFDGEVVIAPAVPMGPTSVGRFPADSEEAFAHTEALCLLGDVIVQAVVAPETAPASSLVFVDGEITQVQRETSVAVRGEPAEIHDDERALVTDLLGAIGDETGAIPTFGRVEIVDLAGPTVSDVELVRPDLMLRRSPATATRLALAVARSVDG